MIGDMCKYSDLFENGRGFEFALDLLELLQVKNENERRAYEASKNKPK